MTRAWRFVEELGRVEEEGTGRLVAQIVRAPGRYDEQNAERRLLAAAPRLLAALRRAVPYLASHVAMTCDDDFSGVGDRLAHDEAAALVRELEG